MQRIAIIGSGAWGTGLAVALRRAKHDVRLWSYEPETAQAIVKDRVNTAFLPEVKLDSAIYATSDIAHALINAQIVLLVTPAQVLRQVCATLTPYWSTKTPCIICTKGVEKHSHALMSDVVRSCLPGTSISILSGPSFAIEVARGLPTAATLACTDKALAKSLAQTISSPTFRIYHSDDVIGVQIGGAVKNVLAIACGIVEGRKLGDNARAALITRGLAEMTRLAIAMGGRIETLMGLSGLGDLTLTCNATQSRNFSFGIEVGRGTPVKNILNNRRAVTEGVHTAAAIVALAKTKNVDMPICQATDALLSRGADLNKIINGLLSRPVGIE